MRTPTYDVENHKVVNLDEWLEARRELMEAEKEETRLRDELSQKRRDLPWVKVENYTFESPEGSVTLSDLFEGRSQLVVQHLMFAPDDEAACPGCSLMADHVDGARLHFEHHDLKFAAVSRASVEQILAYQKRMGWKFPWVSSGESRFNYDFDVSFTPEEVQAKVTKYNFGTLEADYKDLPGVSVFYKAKDGTIYRTYSVYARGFEQVIGAFVFLDIAPKGRDEKSTMDWVKRHDEYEGAEQHSCCH